MHLQPIWFSWCAKHKVLRILSFMIGSPTQILEIIAHGIQPCHFSNESAQSQTRMTRNFVWEAGCSWHELFAICNISMSNEFDKRQFDINLSRTVYLNLSWRRVRVDPCSWLKGEKPMRVIMLLHHKRTLLNVNGYLPFYVIAFFEWNAKSFTCPTRTRSDQNTWTLCISLDNNGSS